MIAARGTRTRASIASTTGSSASAMKTEMTTSRSTSRRRHARYSATAQATTMATMRTTVLGGRSGEAHRLIGIGIGGARVSGGRERHR